MGIFYKGIVFFSILGVLSSCDSENLTKTVLNYNPQESLYYCSGIHMWALQYNQRSVGVDIPTHTLISKAVTRLREYTNGVPSQIMSLVIKGYQDADICNSTQTQKCFETSYKCQDVSTAYWEPIVKRQRGF